MKFIIALLLFTAMALAEDLLAKTPRDEIPYLHFAFDGYEEPEYFRFIEAMLGADYIKRCVKRRFPPEVGSPCRKDPKVCLFGEQTCITNKTGTAPTTRCDCHRGKWSCNDYACPTIDAQCPSQDPEAIDPAPICESDLTCSYGQQRCCDTVFSPKWCTCQAGGRFECTDFEFCTPNNDCAFTTASVGNLLQAGAGRFPGDFLDDVYTSGGGGGGDPPEDSNGALCDIFQQDCSSSLKCTVENIFVGAPRCRSLDGNPDQVGDSCSKLGNNDGDTCDIDGICLDGVCRGIETTSNQCALDEVAHVYPTGVRICEQECDPLLNSSCDSVSGSHCTRTAGSPDGIFSCFVTENTVLGDFGQSCLDDVQCQQGSICVSAEVAPFQGFCDGGATSCCVPLCDLNEVPTFCTGLGFDSTCRSIFNGLAPPAPGHTELGVCVFP